jgi:hypothetical protein
VSALGDARRRYDAELRSAWDSYHHITVKLISWRIVKTSDGAIATARRTGDVARLVDCLRARKPLANDDCLKLADFIATKRPRRRWPKRIGKALSDRTDADYDVLADFVEKAGRGRGRQRNEPVHDATRLAEVLMSVGLIKDVAIKRACEIVGREAGKPIGDAQVRDLLDRPKARRRQS